jgi:DNA primase large subunit
MRWIGRRERTLWRRRLRGRRYKGRKFEGKGFENMELKNVSEDMYPAPIKKLLKGVNEGRKRGLFVLITFLRAINLSPEELNKRIRKWNEKNDPPLKEGYVRSQIEWHLKQRKRILPPNYANESFYRDIGILDKKPTTKNPLVDVMREVRRRK